MASVTAVRAGAAALEPIDPPKIKKSVKNLTRSGDSVTCRGDRCQVDLSGYSVGATSATDIGSGDDRTLTDIGTLLSEHNHVVPLLPESFAAESENDFDTQLAALIDGAKSFIFIQGYDLSREDLIDQLIEKAEQNVQVVALFEPPSKEGNTKHELLEKLQEAGVKNGNIHVAVTSPLSKGQLNHVKRVIADVESASIAEVSGGINFGERAGLNVDSAWRIEGVSALDSLRDLLLHYPDNHDLSFDLSRVPSRDGVEARMKKRLEKTGETPVRIESGRSGMRIMGSPHRYTKKKLLERAKRGDKLIVSADELGKSWVPSALETAVQNGSMVKLVVPNGKRDIVDACKQAIKKHEDLIDRLGISVVHEGMTVIDTSYQQLVLRELDEAISRQETIDVAAFGLTESEIIEKLIEAHHAGCRVRVLVDDNSVQGTLVNQKAIALLTKEGIEVKAFTNDIGKAMGLERAEEHDVKLHAKLMILGRNRVLGGSANFTKQGLNENIEDGKLVRSARVARVFTTRLLEPTWESSMVPRRMKVDAPEVRQLAIQPFPADAAIKDSIFVVYDVETTGWVAEQDERILSVSAVAVRIDNDGNLDELDHFDGYSMPGKNAVGRDFNIPWQVRAVHGLSKDTLEELEAGDIHALTSGFLDFLARVEARGAPVVPVAHNAKFDQRFIDQVLSRSDVRTTRDGEAGRFRLPSASVDTMTLAQTLDFDADGYGLDDLAMRYEILEKKREKHQSLLDARITANILARLLNMGEVTRVGELMGQDRLKLVDTIQLSASPRKMTVRYELEKGRGQKLTLREKDSKTGRYGDDQRVSEVEVVGLHGDMIVLRLQTGHDDDARDHTAYLPADQAVFEELGTVYHGLVEAGRSPEVDASKRPRRKRPADPARAAGADILKPGAPANDDQERSAGGSKANSSSKE